MNEKLKKQRWQGQHHKKLENNIAHYDKNLDSREKN
jgi:hypothetical protein